AQTQGRRTDDKNRLEYHWNLPDNSNTLFMKMARPKRKKLASYLCLTSHSLQLLFLCIYLITLQVHPCSLSDRRRQRGRVQEGEATGCSRWRWCCRARSSTRRITPSASSRPDVYSSCSSRRGVRRVP
uniref:Uncharacterized protein n=1 Tax=Aegilops tauschii subsp. strangulata TaxID=200361 RepID=A0A453M601_AEGTS